MGLHRFVCLAPYTLFEFRLTRRAPLRVRLFFIDAVIALQLAAYSAAVYFISTADKSEGHGSALDRGSKDHKRDAVPTSWEDFVYIVAFGQVRN